MRCDVELCVQKGLLDLPLPSDLDLGRFPTDAWMLQWERDA